MLICSQYVSHMLICSQYRLKAGGEKDTEDQKGTTEDEMAGWHHWLDGHEFEQAPGDGDG